METARIDLQTILILGLVLAAAALALGIGVAITRRKYLKARSQWPAGTGFDITKIERLHREGQISHEEYQTLRRATLGLDEPAGRKDDSTSSAAPAPDDENNEQKEGGPRADMDRDKEQE